MTDALSEKLENYNVDVNLEEVGIVEKSVTASLPLSV